MKERKRIKRLIIFSVALILVSSVVAYIIENREHKKKKGTDENLPFWHFINGQAQLPSWKTILVGLTFGIVFGFLDNFFIYVGIDSLEPILPKDTVLKAGLGNLYSDAIGAIVGTYIANIVQKWTGIDDDEIPIWTNTIGIIIGCLIGIYIPYLLLRTKKK